MTARLDITSKSTRRRLLQGFAAFVSFFGLGATAAYAAKAWPVSVGYRNSPKADQNRANCKLFISPNACKSVSGEISAKGWCKIWKA